MFLEDSTRISTKLIWGDLGELATDSMDRQIDLRRALHLFHVRLVSDLTRSAPLDPLRPVLFTWISLVVDEEGVPFRGLCNKLRNRFAVRLVLEFSDKGVGRRVEEWARLVK